MNRYFTFICCVYESYKSHICTKPCMNMDILIERVKKHLKHIMTKRFWTIEFLDNKRLESARLGWYSIYFWSCLLSRGGKRVCIWKQRRMTNGNVIVCNFFFFSSMFVKLNLAYFVDLMFYLNWKIAYAVLCMI